MFISINMKIQYMMLVTCAALCFHHAQLERFSFTLETEAGDKQELFK